MLTERSADAVRVRAPAKVNLFLEVLARRPDGYHDLATLMVAVGLYDRLEFKKEDVSGAIELSCDVPTLSTGADNLVCRAAELLRRRTGCKRGVRIELQKRIPLAAGLAGGSSDAAATLEGLNQFWQLGLSRTDLAELGAELGSDVAFFFATPAAWCTGRGEIVTPVPLGRPLDLVLVCPAFGLSTPEVYRGVQVPAEPVNGEAMLRAVTAGDLEEIGRRLHNRLQASAESLRPEVAELYGRLAELKPLGQLMSGSGSSLFALCRDRRDGLRLMRELRRRADAPVVAGSGDPATTRVFLVRSCD
jgi:4-diphosphocytidyl-2-C-methyl-D-erythritol kinase